MDSTRVFFTLQVIDVPSADGVSFSVPAPEIDLGATIFLTAEKQSEFFGRLFFSLHSSLENVMFRVRESFNQVAVSVSSGIRKSIRRRRSMWRGRIEPVRFANLLKHSAVMVMRT